MKHQAIYNLYPNVVSISEDFVCKDKDGKIVEYDTVLIQEELDKIVSEKDTLKTNDNLDKDIEKLEKKSLRALREAVLALTENAVLQKAEDDIVALRSQRK